ncbi:hypothetical protein RN22_09725 [Grimontia sp. AD028]|uniref:hypothetical protein n=1 Tax=Grimontia sp. AD028 TaxID=1581149 RepID=UPI00061AAA66|nr:hypothetical protein [Grimontia sp. AD028]KKD60681.1 hypothetical protein RN22_09725 [Grimontia sp. AD028]
MQKRRFYRIDEISDVTALTKGDLLYAVEQGEFGLLAKISVKGIAYSHNNIKGRFVLGDMFDYDGHIALSKSQSQSAILGKVIELTTFDVFQPELATNWRSVSTAFPKANKSGLYVHDVKPLGSKPNKPFRAVAPLVEMPSGLEKVKNYVDEQSEKGIEDKSTFGFFEFVGKALSKMDEKQLAPAKLKIDKESLRFDLEVVKKFFHVEVDRKDIKGLLSGTDESFDHPIYEMIRLVYLTDPDAKPRKVWNAIKADFISGSRVLDREGLILNMDNVCVEWITPHPRDNMKYTSFTTHARNIRSGNLTPTKA